MAKKVKILFLGGVGEIGKNMTAIEYGDDIIIIDCGMSFPTTDMPGIDVVVPDVSYLNANKDKIKGILLTHGHEDHIGALPYVYNDINAPVYGTKLSIALVEHKFYENKIEDYKTVEVNFRQKYTIGCFKVEFIKVCHSFSGAAAISITTPKGVIFVTGDYKMDYTPIDDQLTDIKRISEIGEKGVMVMLGESTNVEREGHSSSEKNVGKTLDFLFEQNKDRRIIVATFASNIYRVQQIITAAKKCGRRVAFSGKSMKRIAEVAHQIGELQYDDKTIVDINEINKIPYDKLIIVCTGSQGEPMSSLARMAMGNNSQVNITNKDTVILSSSPIPGNERSIYGVINNLYKKGAEVVYDTMGEVHVSGHAFQEELKLMLSLVKPKYFIPVHGEYRHLVKHKKIAVDMGVLEENVFIPNIGDVFAFTGKVVTKCPKIPAGNIFVDGVLLDDGDTVIRDRLQISSSGLLIAFLSVNFKTGEITSNPEIITRGLNFSDAFIKELKQIIIDTINNINIEIVDDYSELKVIIRKALKKVVIDKYRQTPMIMPIILES